MADKRIKGITIELDGDTTDLDRAIKGVVKESVKLQGELKEVERSLKFNPGNSELIAQKQELLASQIESTTKKLDALRQAQSQVEAQFQSGKISGEQYRAFQRELITTETGLQGLQNKLTATAQEQQELERKTRQLQTLFAATGTDIDRYADALGVGLVNAIKSGNASSKQLDKVISEVGKTALGASIEVDKLKSALKSADDGNSLKNIKKELSEVAKEAKSAGDKVNGFGSELTSIIGGLAAGGGIAGVVSSALDTSNLNTRIDISFDVPEESKASVKGALREVKAYGVEGEEALEGLRRQWALNKNASDEANASLVKQAAVVAASYQGIDFIELIQETNEIASALGISNEEAIALTNSLLKAGFPPEQLDTIAEYGTQMKDAGFEAREIQSIFEAGIDTKTWNIDNLNDGVKEARIQMATFGQEVPKAVQPLLEQVGMSEEQFQNWGKAIAAGGEEGSKAMSEVVTWLDNIEDAAVKNELATKVFGTKWEDQGQNMISVFKGLSEAVDQTGENAALLDEQMSTLDADPAIQMQKAISELKVALSPLLMQISKFVAVIAKWAAENPILFATITAIATVLGIVTGAIVALTPVVVALTTATGAFGVAINTAIWPITLIVAAIAAVIAIGVLLYKNWDEISAYAVEIWTGIKEFFVGIWESITSTVTEVWNGIKNFFIELWEGIRQTISDVWEGIKNFFKQYWVELLLVFAGPIVLLVGMFIKYWDEIKAYTSKVWESIKEFFVSLWQSIKDIFNTVLKAIFDHFKTQFEFMKSVATTVWNAIKSTASTIWNAIKSFFVTTISSIVSTVTEKFENIKTSIKEKMESVKTTISNIWDNVMTFFKNIDLKQMGKDIIQGLINGITSMAKKAVESVKEVASSISNTIKDFFGINSPAKLTMGDGRDIVRGLAVGMDKNINTAIRSAAAVSSSVHDAMQGTSEWTTNAQTYSSGTGTNVVAPVISAAGMFDGATLIMRDETDINLLADLVARKLHGMQQAALRGAGG